MFRESANIYDTIYLNMGKDYVAESKKIHAIVQRYKKTNGKFLLDVACGTGLHIGHFRQHYQVEGLDLDPGMLKIARRKYPRVRFHRANMLDFVLHRKFDVITCLFSSIGYVKTIPRLNKAIQNMGQHLKPGGVLIFEPWFTPQQWRTGKPHGTFANEPNLKIARMNVSGRKGKISLLDFHYLVATSEGVKYFSESHELGLFTHVEYLRAFKNAGLKVIHDKKGLDGRGLYIGLK